MFLQKIKKALMGKKARKYELRTFEKWIFHNLRNPGNPLTTAMILTKPMKDEAKVQMRVT